MDTKQAGSRFSVFRKTHIVRQTKSVGKMADSSSFENNLSLFTDTFELLHDAVCIVNEAGEIIFTNSAFRYLLGYDNKPLEGMLFADLVHSEETLTKKTAPFCFHFFQRARELPVDLLLRRSNNHNIYVRIRTNIISGPQRKSYAVGIFQSLENILPENKKETSLPSSKETLENIFAHSGDGIIISNSNGDITKTNTALCSLLNYAEEALLQKHFIELSPAEGAYLDKNGETVEITETYITEQVRAAEDLFTYGKVTCELYYKDSNNILIPVETTVSLLKNNEGDIIGAITLVRDITERKKAEREIRGSRDFLEKVFTTAADGFLVTDEQGVIIRANRMVFEMLGAEEQNLLGINITELIPAGFTPPPLVEELFQKGFVKNYESLWQKKDGSYLSIEATLATLKDDSGNITGAVSSVRDISARKKTEQHLKESEERFRLLAEKIPEAILATDLKGQIVFWNNGAQKLFGYELDEIFGKNCSVLVPARFKEPDREGMASLHTRNLDGLIIEGVGLKKDGSEFDDEIAIGPWETSQGMYYVAIVRNISDRKQALDALRESEKRFKELADSLPQTVFELDLSGQVTFVNRSALENFGYTLKDFDNGILALDMIVPEQRLQVKQRLEKALLDEKFSGHEYLALRKDGTSFPIIIHATPVMQDGRPQGLRGLVIDISQRKKLEEELLKAKRLESIAALAGGVARDFNNVLSSILGNINIAQELSEEDATISEALEQAEKATLQARDLTAQLISFSKSREGKKKKITITDLLKQSAKEALKSSRVFCSFSFSEKLSPVEINEEQIKQVFRNLIINADRAMPEGGTLFLSAQNSSVRPDDNLPLANGDYLKITFRDQSIGILNEHLQNVFDPYFTSRQRGSGIGLATTYTIIKNHGGLITVESEFGKGTTFFIYLPALQSHS